jgi:hypothetical protein
MAAFAILINASLYLYVTAPSISQYLEGSISEESVLTPDPAIVAAEEDQQIIIESLQQQLADLQTQVSTAPQKVVVEKHIVERVSEPVQTIIERVVEQPQIIERIVEVQVPTPVSAPAVQAPDGNFANSASQNGKTLVTDTTCDFGKAWLDARLEKTCALANEL